ncbi:MAG: GDP-L-fucose synthase [Flavobacteriales bacterium]|nr:GDP-L-fucose synthase [Flavobacteriales bacterium]
MQKESKIYVAGHRGMVGSAIVRRLQSDGYNNIVTRTSAELDLRNQAAVQSFFAAEQPEYVFMSAAKVGGIVANNTYRADFIYDNLMIEANVIRASHDFDVKKMLFLGSSCIYPKLAPQPLKEEYLLEGYLEPTNEPYAIAKIAGIKLSEAFRDQYGCNFISAMPTNLYGPNDNYDLQNSHVLPALLRKFHAAVQEGKQEVEIWGTGSPKREFLHVDDLADACFYLMLNYDDRGFVNVGTGTDVSIKELAEIVARVTGFKGRLVFDTSKPDGTPRKLMDVGRLHRLGWKHRIDLEDGVKAVYEGVKDSELFTVSA